MYEGGISEELGKTSGGGGRGQKKLLDNVVSKSLVLTTQYHSKEVESVLKNGSLKLPIKVCAER
jgi:hypothetical protein